MFFASRARLAFIIYMKHFKFFSKKAILSDVHFSGGIKRKAYKSTNQGKEMLYYCPFRKKTMKTSGMILSTFF